MLLSPSPLRCMAKSSFTALGHSSEEDPITTEVWVVYLVVSLPMRHHGHCHHFSLSQGVHTIYSYAF